MSIDTEAIRRFDRVAASLPVIVNTEKNRLSGVVRQISCGGAFIDAMVRTKLSANARVRLEFDLGDGSGNLKVDATVIYVAQTESALRGFGVRFVDPEEGTVTSLDRFVEEQKDSGLLIYDSKGKRAVEQGWAASRFLRTVVDSASVWLSVIDEHGNRVLWNRAAEEISGYSREEVYGHDQVVRWLYPDANECLVFLDNVRNTIESGRPCEGFETDIVTKGGGRRTMQWDLRCLDEGDSRIGVAVLGRDVTELRETEARLRRAQQLEAVGRMAGGVAHDFNNMLTVIMVATSNLSRLVGPGNPLMEDIQSIETCTTQAAALTRQLVAFSRQQVLNPRSLSLNDLVEDSRLMLTRAVGDGVELMTFLAPSIGPTRVDPVQMQQVLVNLALNGRDAMEGQGTLTIETDEIRLSDGSKSHHDEIPPGYYILLTVNDTGCGMDEATSTRIFEPFFTTKPEGEGSGLGLSTVYGVVKQSGGFIWVYSEPGQGTTFKLYLPHADAAQATPPAAPLRDPHRGTETVLVVEDREDLRRQIVSDLTRRGYHVLEAADGADGENVASSHGGRIDVLLTDIVMPRLTGPELANRLTKVLPDLKIIFMSGYSEQVAIHQGLLSDKETFLQKPFPPTLVAERLRRLIDGQKPSS